MILLLCTTSEGSNEPSAVVAEAYRPAFFYSYSNIHLLLLLNIRNLYDARQAATLRYYTHLTVVR